MSSQIAVTNRLFRKIHSSDIKLWIIREKEVNNFWKQCRLNLFLRMGCRIDRPKHCVNNSQEIRVSIKWWVVREKSFKI